MGSTELLYLCLRTKLTPGFNSDSFLTDCVSLDKSLNIA